MRLGLLGGLLPSRAAVGARSPPVLKAIFAAFVVLRTISLSKSGVTYKDLVNRGYSFDKQYLSFDDVHNYRTIIPSSRPFQRVVVCVGGFGDSPAAFDPLVEKLKDEPGVCVTLPPTPGWDRWDGFKKARQLSYVDWKIACRRAICEANALGEEVVLVAHSTGATVALACLLGEDDGQGVDRVVFTGANLGPAPSDRKTKSMLTSRVGKFLTYLKPVVKKKLREGKPVDVVNEHYWDNGFYLSSIPTNAVREMWLCMDEILEEEEKLLHSRVKRVAIINGEFDKSVCPISEAVNVVSSKIGSAAPCKVDARIVRNAGHSILFEKESTGAVDIVVKEVMRGDEETERRTFFSGDE